MQAVLIGWAHGLQDEWVCNPPNYYNYRYSVQIGTIPTLDERQSSVMVRFTERDLKRLKLQLGEVPPMLTVGSLVVLGYLYTDKDHYKVYKVCES